MDIKYNQYLFQSVHQHNSIPDIITIHNLI